MRDITTQPASGTPAVFLPPPWQLRSPEAEMRAARLARLHHMPLSHAYVMDELRQASRGRRA